MAEQGNYSIMISIFFFKLQYYNFYFPSGLCDQLDLMEPHFIRTANDRTSTVNRNENRSVQLLMALQSNSDHIKGLLRHQTTSSIVDNPPSQLLAEKQTQNSLEKKNKKMH